MLTYQGYKILSFDSLEAPVADPYFDQSKSSDLYRIYGEAAELNFSIPSNQSLKFEINELKRFIQDLKDDKSDWFFTIEYQNDIHQYEKVSDDEVQETIIQSGVVHPIRIHQLFTHIQSWPKSLFKIK